MKLVIIDGIMSHKGSMQRRAEGIKLADGSIWDITAGDEQASFIISRLTEAMQLQPVHRPARRLIVLADNSRTGPAVDDSLFDWTIQPSESGETVICSIKPSDNRNALALQLKLLSLVICLHTTQIRGGLLLHGALAEWKGDGVILAGPWGIGKTTASQRLTSPWNSLCDDLTLVVCDEQRVYWAHPWPTWSRFVPGGPGGTWDVQHAVPLRGIFFLVRAPEDLVEPVGVGQAVCLLVESAEQAWWELHHGIKKDKGRMLRLQRFDNICVLAQGVPCFLLHLSPTGTFWQEIEKAITSD